jgi:hypothetical protein
MAGHYRLDPGCRKCISNADTSGARAPDPTGMVNVVALADAESFAKHDPKP